MEVIHFTSFLKEVLLFQFIKLGLNVTLSTDDPLQFHNTNDPLIEEYSVAAQIWRLSSIDISEIARNSVLQSGFSLKEKQKMLGDDFHLGGKIGNNVHYSNIPNIRVLFREDCYEYENKYLISCLEHSD
jgi:AMP deaminase